MEKKFQILRFVGTVYKIFGIIAGVITVLIAIGACLVSVLGGPMMEQLGGAVPGLRGGATPGMGVVGGIIASLLFLLYGGGLAITLYAAGEGVYLLIALEENTRRTAQAISQNNNDNSQPPPEVG